jgi:hypothetical protein
VNVTVVCMRCVCVWRCCAVHVRSSLAGAGMSVRQCESVLTLTLTMFDLS